MKSVVDTTTWSITYDCHSHNSRGVIYNLHIIIIHVSGDVFTDFCFIVGLGMNSIILTSWQLSITNSSDGIRAPFKVRFNAGNPYWRDRLSTVGLLVLNSLEQLLLIMQTSFIFLPNKLPERGGQRYWAFYFSKCSQGQYYQTFSFCNSHFFVQS